MNRNFSPDIEDAPSAVQFTDEDTDDQIVENGHCTCDNDPSLSEDDAHESPASQEAPPEPTDEQKDDGVPINPVLEQHAIQRAHDIFVHINSC